MKTPFILTLALLAAPLAQADTSQAEQLVRAGRPADAVDALANDSSTEAMFWKGRALIDLGRLKEATKSLLGVPDTHELYPYAAKALLYCAWKNKDDDFAAIATPMATGNNQEIAALATAALAEYWLSKPKSQDNSALQRLRSIAEKTPAYKHVLQLLEIENLRLRGEFNTAIEQCRAMEADTSLPITLRHRARLALSSIYYDKEAADLTPQDKTLPMGTQEGNAEAMVEFDDGKGEETLLHFISSHPDSPLLEEAFLRLYKKNAFATSEYARTKLNEWIADPAKSRRAANALLIQQHMLNHENAPDLPLDVTCVNTAASTHPNEQATRTILLEQIRWYLERNQTHEALLYMGMLRGDDALRNFYEAQMHDAGLASTARAYLECARTAPENLRNVALQNAMISALLSNDTALQEEILHSDTLSEAQRFALLRTRAAYLLEKAPEKAGADLNMLLGLPCDDANLKADVEMDIAFLHLQDNPEKAREQLLRSNLREQLPQLTPDRQLRFFALQETALRNVSGTADSHNAGQKAIEKIRNSAGKVLDPQVVCILTLHLAHLQSAEGQHTQALRTLKSLLRKYPRMDFAPRALYMSARISEQIASMDSLKHAAELYDACARQSEELRIKATIRKAAVLLRMGEHEGSERILTHMLRKEENLRSQDKVKAYAVLANNKALLGTGEGRREAVAIAAKELEDPALPRWWKFRALLHHATLCARADMFAEALKDYEQVLAMQPATGANPSAADWHILYSAGSGAVLQLIHLERYNEAADKADQIAAWNKEAASPAKSKQFSDWAEFIRQTNFIENKSLPF